MKAFGVRLAAGTVTILMGAMMAAQAQKDHQDSTHSAWTEEKLPPAKTASPISLADHLTPAKKLMLAKPGEAESLKSIVDAPSSDPSPARGVVLVQHTQPSGSMEMPEGNSESDPDSKSDKPPASSKSTMKMGLPSFDDVPSLETEAADGPSFSMGLPVVDTKPSAVPNKPEISEITFADTPGSVLKLPAEKPAVVTAAQAGGDVPGPPPSNDLRSGSPSNLRETPGTNTAGLDTAGANTSPQPLRKGMADGPAIGIAALGAAVFGGAALAERANTDSVDPNANPSLVATNETANAQSEFAGAPNSTLRIQADAPVQLEIGGQPPANPVATAQPTGTFGAATFGVMSQAKIVGDTDSPPATGGPTNPLAPTTLAPTTLAPATGGYGVPAGYGLANQVPANNSRSAPALPTPDLAMPLPPAAAIAAQPLLAPGMRSPGLATQPAYGQPIPGGTTIQGVGYKQNETAPLLPPGPTLASPGERFLDGPQSPSIVIHKRAPAEVKVGKPASFVITVKNVGGSKALDVQVHDRVPAGMTLIDATPRPNPKYQPELFWELGDLEPNQERTITLQLTPEQEGELGSVARVTFHAAASVRTISTRPELKVVQKALEEVLIGQQLEIELEISNPGSGEATGVILQEDVPDGLEHPQGKQLDNLIGTLAPGEVRRQILRMRAVKPGIVENVIRVKGDDGLETTHTIVVKVISPELKATLTGPSRRYLERQATYQLDIANVGTANATNVELSVQLDRGFTFVKTDFEGRYDAARHAVFWSLPALPAGQSGKVPLTLLPVQEGNRVLRTEATADLGIRTASDTRVTIDSLAELTFSINDNADPIEVGGQTTYEIRISNTGSRDDTNVRVAIQLPPGLEIAEQGDFTAQGQGIIAFSPKALLKANDEIVYTLKANGIAPGRHIVKAIVTSDQSDVPVTKEESIKVYADQ